MVLSSGVVKKIAVSTAAPTYTGSTGVTVSGSNVTLGGNLSAATTIGTSSTNTLKLTGVQSGASTDSLVVMNNGVVKKMNPYTGSNGVTISGNGIKLGGNLSSATTIGTSSSNTLVLTGVQSGSTSDSLMVLSSGVVKKVSQSSISSPWTHSGSNTTLTNSGDNVGVGKTPSYDLDVSGFTNSDSFGIGGNTFLNAKGTHNTFTGVSAGKVNSATNNTFTGYQAGSLTSSGGNNTAVGYQAANTNTTGTKNTIIGATADVSSSALSNATALGYNAIVGQSNSIVLGATGTNQPNVGIGTTTPASSALLELSSTSKGMLIPRMTSSQRTSISSPATGLEVYDTDSGYAFFYNGSSWKGDKTYTASNGITSSGSTIKFGGNLSSATTIGTSSTNTLKLTGVQSGSTSDSLMVLSSGVVKKVSQSSISSPWTHSGSNTTLTNSGDNVGVGKTPSYDLDVNGLTNSDSFGIAGFTVLKLKGTRNVFVGKNTAPGNSGSDNTMLGFQAGYKNTYGDENVFIGSTAGVSNTAGNDNIFLGYAAGYSNGTGSSNFFSGSYSGYSNTSGSSNTFSGDGAGYSNTTGSYNVFSGGSAGISNTTGSANTFTGDEAGDNNSTGSDNVFTGVDAGVSNTTGNFNVFTGTATGGINTTGAYNTFTGSESGFSNSTGHDNIFMGFMTGGINTTGNNNVVIGDSADVGSSGLNNAIAIGYKAVVNSSNSMVFGNSSVTGWGFGAATPSSTKVFIVGTTSGNGNGAYLTAGGTWTNASDVNLKENFSNLDGADVLNKISKLNITRWMYKGTEDEYHIGPMAQDFYAAFNVGVNNRSISTIDPAGVALIGVQELKKRNDELQKTNDALVQKNVELENKLNGVEELVKQVRDAQIACCRQAGNLEQAAVLDVPVLGQSTPNPFSENTVISYYLPASTGSASVIITDMNGKALQSFKLTQNGNGQILVGGNALASGTYNYTLIVNGTQVDTKRMIITK